MAFNNGLILCWGESRSGRTTQFAITYNIVFTVIHSANDPNPEDGGIVASTYTSLTNSSCYFWTGYNDTNFVGNLVTYIVIGS